MEIIRINDTIAIRKSKREIERELKKCKNEIDKILVNEYKFTPKSKPTYIVEMSMEELQLVSFYLELEKREPIMNINIVKGGQDVSSKR